MQFKERLAGALRRKWVRALLAVPALLIIIAASIGVDYGCHRGRIYPGVHLQEISLGGLTPGEAKAGLAEKLWSLDELRLSDASSEGVVVRLSDLGVSWDKKGTMALILKEGAGRSGYKERLRRIWTRSPLQLEGIMKVDAIRLHRFTSRLAEQIEENPRDARFVVQGSKVTIEEEARGRFLQAGLLRKRILEAVRNGRDEVRLPIGVKEPARTAAALTGYDVDQVMAEFATTVSPSIPNRVHNIGLGSEAINGYLLPPGGIFSFEAVVGDSTREKGYREAPVIVGGKLVPGLGGGLCQVSTTLYNAALIANLEIVERYNHSLTIGYVPVGRDATISIGSADLKFKNSRDHYILIGAELKGGRLTFRLFGPPMKERVEIFSSDLVRLDPPVHNEKSNALKSGEIELFEKGKAGYRVKTWRAVYLDGREISRELLSYDHYRPVPTLYRIGIGE